MLAAQTPRATSQGIAATRPSPSLQRARELLEHGHTDEARVELLREIGRDPTSVDSYNLLGVLYSVEKNDAASLDAFRHALKLAPNSVKTHINLGNLFLSQDKIDLAEKEFKTALHTDPHNRDANYSLGVLLLARGSANASIACFERIHPADPAAQLKLAQAYFTSKRVADGLRLAAALSAANQADVKLHFSLGYLLISEGQYQAAQRELERADVLEPDTFDILYNLGQAYLLGGIPSKAGTVFQRALILKPDSIETLQSLAQADADQSRPMDALELLVSAHKIAPLNTDVIYLMAKISISQNYFEDAIPLLESGIQVAPQRADLRAALGKSYFLSGKVDKAIEQFKVLIEIQPSATSYSFLGISYRQLGRLEEAKQYFEQGIKLDPHNSACLFNLGLIAERRGNTVAAETLFQQALREDPNYADALLELANLRIAAKRLPEAAELLKKYVKLSHSPSTGYYKLAMVERNLHETAAADRYLKEFQALSKTADNSGAYPYEHLYDYLDSRSRLGRDARQQLDIAELTDQIEKHPDQSDNYYFLAEAYLKAGKTEEARSTIAQLDRLSVADYRTLTGAGVLLARYRFYKDAIQHFQMALGLNSTSDEIKFDLADAYFRQRDFRTAMEAVDTISEAGRADDAYLDLLGDILAHVGETARAEKVFRDALSRKPDNDQDYLSLALLQLRRSDIKGASETLQRGQARVPGSGKILWGLGLVSALEGNTAEATDRLERAVDLLPEWPGSYSTLGVFYFQTGQIDKAKEVLGRFKNSKATGGFDVARIEQVLDRAATTKAAAADEPMTVASREQLLQVALSLADRTL